MLSFLRAELLYVVHHRPLASVAVSRDCYSVGYSPPGSRSGTALDANYRRARRPDNLGSQQGLSTVARGSGCASVLPYILLYGADAKVSIT
jgi:hypothetical protein